MWYSDLGGKITRLETPIIISIYLLIGFSIAGQTDIKSTILEGDVGDSISIVPPSTITLDLAPGDIASKTGTLQVNANRPWDLKVRSDDQHGKMKEWTGSAYVQGGRSLANPLHVYYSPKDVELSIIDDTLIENCQELVKTCIIEFYQEAAMGDQRVDPPRTYHIVVTFTGSLRY
jgi:hypothetical protein